MKLLDKSSPQYIDLWERRTDIQAEIDALGRGDTGVPDAPFRTSWPLQIFKRALRDAVSAGHSWIGWTTGDTQADRYDLSKQLDHLEYNYDATTQTGDLNGLKDDQQIIQESDVPVGKLADYIGKDLAQKLMETAKPDDVLKGDWQVAVLTGKAIKVEHSGMKGFYDTILPKEIGKYVKQWGAGVQPSTLSGSGQPPSTTANGSAATLQPPQTSPSTPIWRIDITPQMKAGVEAGQALFATPRRAYESMTFDPPFHTRFGDILSYDWMNQPVGGLSSQRTSDWSRARTNPATGRDIVHHFKVRKPDGIHTVSLETALGQLTEPQRHKLQSLIKSEQRRREEAANGQMTLFAGQRVTPEQDAEYIQAVKDGNVAKQQSMVDEAAKKAGYDSPKVFHGRGSEFTTFDKKYGGTRTQARSAKHGFFFSTDEATAKSYAVYAAEEGPIKDALQRAENAERRGDWDGYDKQVQEAERLDTYFQKLENRKNANVVSAYLRGDFNVFDAEGKTPQELSEDDIDEGITNQIIAAKKAGKTGVIFKNLDDAINLSNRPSDHYFVFTPSQIKSADPITRDAEGNVIPLSQRFNPESNSILFAAKRQFTSNLHTSLAAAATQRAPGSLPVPAPVTTANNSQPPQTTANASAAPLALLQRAYTTAAIGQSTLMLPIRRVYEQAHLLDPTLTPAAFMRALKAADDSGHVLLEPYDTPASLAAAAPFIVRNASGIPSISMALAASKRVANSASDATVSADDLRNRPTHDSRTGAETAPGIIARNVLGADRRRARQEPPVAALQGNRPAIAEEYQRLARYAAEKGLIFDPSRLGPEKDSGGEHRVYQPASAADQGRVFKTTFPGLSGLTRRALRLKDGGIRVMEDDALPSEYLDRCALHNEMLGDASQFEGILESPHGPSIVTSQPYVDGQHPPASPDLTSAGWTRQSTFWTKPHPTESGLLIGLADTKASNWIQENPSGDVISIDTIPFIVTDAMLPTLAPGSENPASSNEHPAALPASARVELAAATTDPNPSPAQKEAGNYPKGKVTLHGLRLSIENPRGSTRSGTDATGKAWSVTLPHHYGYFLGTTQGTNTAADNADPDNDGVPNLIEFATGKDPTSAQSAAVAVPTVNSGTLEYSYTRSLDALNSGATFTVQWNDTLDPSLWSSSGVSETVLSDNGLLQQVKATLPASSTGRRFVRLNVLPPAN